MWLIAIDEAGYGPKLGPLVVAATLWRRDDAALDAAMQDRSIDAADPDAFIPIAGPVCVQSTAIRVDDSKQIFRSRASGKSGGSLAMLQRIVSVSHHACGRTEPDLACRIATLIPDDFARIADVPWLASLTDSRRIRSIVESAWTPRSECDEAIAHWSRSPWQLIDVAARMIDAGCFNQFCGAASGANKSDLLGETSIALAANLLRTLDDRQPPVRSPTNEPVQIYFDRHGGRRYYAAPLQPHFGKTPVQVISESARQSVYETRWSGRTVRMHFSVKGDRFIPVALSSLHAKYLREVAMASLNDYFRERCQAVASKGDQCDSSFVPTAGYPTDADRFLNEIAAAIRAERISLGDLVRCR